MPKLKTRKAVLKRFKVTGTKKLLRRKSGQNHFNAKESSRITKSKKTTLEVDKNQQKIFRKEIPYI